MWSVSGSAGPEEFYWAWNFTSIETEDENVEMSIKKCKKRIMKTFHILIDDPEYSATPAPKRLRQLTFILKT